MINTLAQMDYVASAGTSPWHRAAALGKLLLAVALIALAVFSPSLRLLLALYAGAWALVASARLPARLVIAAAGYPLLFTALFVLSHWDGTAVTPLRIALRPLTASLAAVWLVGTTPYPDLFAPLSRLLPRGAGDGLFLTYRAVFTLLSRAEGLRRSLRLRGAMTGPAKRRMTMVGEGVATLVTHGFERSQRLYSTMLLRGHSGRVCGCRHWAEWSRADLWVGFASLAFAGAAALLWRSP